VYIYTYVVDLNSKIKGLLEKIEKLENEKQQIREEFGHQRAKMKELYLQKEGNFILKSKLFLKFSHSGKYIQHGQVTYN
jgi:hypothetical protein